MTNTPHGQMPEALRLAEQYDHGDPATHGNAWKAAVCTELLRQHARIAELEAQIEALSGVQALSAAPEGWKLVPEDATEEMVRATDKVNFANADTDGTMHNVWNVMLAASPTPPAEQQAQLGAMYAELPEPFRKSGTQVQADGETACTCHLFCIEQMRAFADATHALRTQQPAPAKVVYSTPEEMFDAILTPQPAPQQEAQDSVSPRHPVVMQWRDNAIEACAKIADAYGHEHAAQDMRAMLTAPQQEAQEPVAWLEYARKKPSLRRLVFTKTPDKDLRAVGWVAEPLSTPAPQPAPAPLSERAEREAVARAIWELMREHEDRCDVELEDLMERHPIWSYADAARAALAAQGGNK